MPSRPYSSFGSGDETGFPNRRAAAMAIPENDALSDALAQLNRLVVDQESLDERLNRVAALSCTTVSVCNMAAMTLMRDGRPSTDVCTDEATKEIDAAQDFCAPVDRTNRRALRLRWIDTKPKAHAFQFDGGQRRRLAAFEHIRHRGRHALADLRKLLGALRRLDKAHVGARFHVAVDPLDSGIEPFDGARVRARDDDEIAILPRIHRLLDLANHLLRADDLLALVMPALFRRDLILKMKRRRARLLELTHRAHDIECIAVTGVGIRDHRNIHRLGRQADPAPDFSEGEQAEIRVAVRARIAAAGQIHRLETRKLHQPRGERVECAGRHDVAVLRYERSERLALLHKVSAGGAWNRYANALMPS